jgi:hypothetical protein
MRERVGRGAPVCCKSWVYLPHQGEWQVLAANALTVYLFAIERDRVDYQKL